MTAFEKAKRPLSPLSFGARPTGGRGEGALPEINKWNRQAGELAGTMKFLGEP